MVPEDKDDVVSLKASDTRNPTDAPAHTVLQVSSSEDEESGHIGEGRVDAARWSFQRVYRRYKMLFHFAIWAVWTR